MRSRARAHSFPVFNAEKGKFNGFSFARMHQKYLNICDHILHVDSLFFIRFACRSVQLNFYNIVCVVDGHIISFILAASTFFMPQMEIEKSWWWNEKRVSSRTGKNPREHQWREVMTRQDNIKSEKKPHWNLEGLCSRSASSSTCKIGVYSVWVHPNHI